MWLRRITAVVVVALATPIAAGCGGSSGLRDANQIRTAWKTFATALAADDGAAACSAMTPRLAHSIETIEHSRARTPAFSRASCAKIMRVALQHKGTDWVLQPLVDGAARDIRIADGTAKFNVHSTFHDQGVKIPGAAKKVAGVWRISCCLGPGIAG